MPLLEPVERCYPYAGFGLNQPLPGNTGIAGIDCRQSSDLRRRHIRFEAGRRGRHRTATWIRLEAVDACELRQKAQLGDVDWPCGAVATWWLASRTLLKEVECRPTRVLSGEGIARSATSMEGT